MCRRERKSDCSNSGKTIILRREEAPTLSTPKNAIGTRALATSAYYSLASPLEAMRVGYCDGKTGTVLTRREEGIGGALALAKRAIALTLCICSLAQAGVVGRARDGARSPSSSTTVCAAVATEGASHSPACTSSTGVNDGTCTCTAFCSGKPKDSVEDGGDIRLALGPCTTLASLRRHTRR